MACIFDNDVVWFLAATDMLSAAFESLDTDPADCLRLPTAIHMLRSQRTLRRLKKQYTEVDFASALVQARINEIPELNAVKADRRTLDILSSYEGLDEGEVLVFALVPQSNYKAVTGDLRAVSSLSIASNNHDELKGLYDRRIVTLLCVLALLVRHLGGQYVQEKCALAGVMNKTVRSVLGSQFDAPVGSVREGIDSFRKAETEASVFELWWPDE